MNVLILGDGDEELSWASWILRRRSIGSKRPIRGSASADWPESPPRATSRTRYPSPAWMW